MVLQSSIAWESLIYALVLIGLAAGLSYWYRDWKRPRKNRSLSRAKKNIASRNKAAQQSNRIKNRAFTQD